MFKKNIHNRHTIKGFSLIELLVTLVILGIMLQITLSFWGQSENRLYDTAYTIMHVTKQAKAKAIFLNDTVHLKISPDVISIHHRDALIQKVPIEAAHILAINEIPINSSKQYISINKLGLIQENIIWLGNNEQRITLYTPAIGNATIYQNHITFNAIYKGYL